MYQYHQNTIAIEARLLYEDLAVMTESNYKKMCYKGRLDKIRTGGNGRSALIRWESLDEDIKAKVVDIYGDPYAQDSLRTFISKLEPDEAAADFYKNANLTEERERQYYAEAQILNAYGKLLAEMAVKKRRNPGFKVTDAKRKLSKIVSELKSMRYPNSDMLRYPHRLPSNPRSLERKYEEYKAGSYQALIHGNEGNDNSKKIKDAIADWLLATYCLPNKPNTTILHREYRKEAAKHGWPGLTEAAIYTWLQKTEQRKVWVLARHGKDEYIRQFGHKIVRDRSDWFPYCYLAIDGSKLDWIHYKEGGPYGMGADIKINLVFDVFSEKIIGWDFTDTEDHQSHFRTWKMAIQECGVKPTLITYDNQSGHKMETMQALYDRLVTPEGGQHYPHRANEHGSPIEQLFARFQKQVLNTMWFSDKQAITVRTADSRPNMDFVRRFAHKLKPVEALREDFAYCVEKWNAMPHPKHEAARNYVATYPQTYKLEAVNEIEMMELFWVTTKKPSTYERDGIRATIAKQDYHFEVYDIDGRVDIDFRDRYTGSKFFLQYDPDQLDNYVRLYVQLPNGTRKFVTNAEPVKVIKSIPALMDEHDKGRMHKMTAVRDEELKRVEARLEALRHRTNITEEKMVEDQELELKFKGKIPKEARSLVEASAGSWTSKL
jgi:hypothetical protein